MDLPSIQKLVNDIEVEKGHITDDLMTKMLVKAEEDGELAKAILEDGNKGEELADCLFCICAIANRLGLDLGSLFVAKFLKKDKEGWVIV
jgi:NTP pyrophosphatase (non-canonical NTP hydrolase)